MNPEVNETLWFRTPFCLEKIFLRNLKLTKVRGHICHLCIEKAFAQQKSAFGFCVRFKFLTPERIKYLRSEKLLMPLALTDVLTLV